MLQPPIENWEQLQTAACLLLLLVVGNAVVIVGALALRRRLNAIEATRPPSSAKRPRRPRPPQDAPAGEQPTDVDGR